MRSQIATSNIGLGGRRYLPYVFTEQGVAMLSTVLNSEQAIEVNIAIMRVFVRLRRMLETNEELNRKYAAVIKKLSVHDKYFRVVFDEIKKLTEKPVSSGRQIGFKRPSKLSFKIGFPTQSTILRSHFAISRLGRTHVLKSERLRSKSSKIPVNIYPN